LNRTRPVINGIQIVAALGIDAIYQVLAVPVQASVPDVDDTGLAMGILVTFRLLGGLVGLAVGSTVFTSRFQASIRVLEPLPDAVKALGDASQAVAVIPTLRKLDLAADPMTSITDAYLESLRGVWYVLAAVATLGFICSLFIKELSLEKEDISRQQFVVSKYLQTRVESYLCNLLYFITYHIILYIKNNKIRDRKLIMNYLTSPDISMPERELHSLMVSVTVCPIPYSA
jgi:hypothetical protein